MGLFDSAYESREMTLDTMSEGVSKAGMEELVDLLQAQLLIGVSEKLEETEAINNALKANWQGKSRDVFIENMTKSIRMIKADLAAEFGDLMNKLAELAQSYYDQDKKMMDMLN